MKHTTVFAAIAVMCVAVALPSFADTTLTWNGADGASWTTGENWLDGETPSAWVDGASAVFPSAATVTLDGAVTVSNLTTSGTLTVAGSNTASCENFLTTSDALVFPGLRLADITAIDGTMAGGYFGATPRVEAHAYHYDFSGTTGSAQFQCNYGEDLRCVRVEFSEKSDGVYAKAVGKTGYVPKANRDVKRECIGGDANKMPDMLWIYNVATADDVSGYGVCNLRASTSCLAVVGEATLGGTLTVTNAATEVTAPIAQTWSQSVVCPNGRITVKGLSSATTDKTYGITDPKAEKAASVWLTATASDTVLTNMVLSRTVPVSGVMRGSYIGYNAPSSIHHVKFDGQTMTFQIQCLDQNNPNNSAWIKGSLVELKQSGANVTARAIRTYLYYFSEGESKVTGVDLEAAGSAASPGTYSVAQYAVKSLVLRTVNVPSLTLSANNRTCIDMVVDNAQLVFSQGQSQPLKLIARNCASVIYNEGPYNEGGSFARRFEAGSTLLCPGSLKTEGRADWHFNASTNVVVIKNYFNELTLQNGSRIIGGGNLEIGYYNFSPTSTYSSVGTSANFIEAPVELLRHNLTGAKTNTFVIATAADLTISKTIKDSTVYTGANIVKRGAAKLALSGNNTFAGRFTIEEGTVELGSDTALPATAPLTLAGGTVTCGATANSTGPLTLSGNATINLGSGSLAFADSSGEAWASGKILAITGNDSIPTQSLRFGTSKNGLTRAQLRQISYNGERVALDDDGYLRQRDGIMLIVR